MRVTTKGRYALRAMANLAASANGSPKPIKRIAAEEELSPEFLEQIFFRLKKAGIIDSVRGPGGGFMLRKEASEINIREIFEAVDEGLDITPCSNCTMQGGGDVCDLIDTCLVHNIWKEAADHIISFFEGMTLQRILDRNQDKVEMLLSGKRIDVS